MSDSKHMGELVHHHFHSPGLQQVLSVFLAQSSLLFKELRVAPGQRKDPNSVANTPQPVNEIPVLFVVHIGESYSQHRVSIERHFADQQVKHLARVDLLDSLVFPLFYRFFFLR